MPSTPIFTPALRRLVHRVLDGAQHGAQGDDDGFGVVQAIRFDQTARVASKNLAEFLCHLRNQVQRLHLLGVGQVAHLGKGLRANHGADRHGFVRVQHLARLVGRQEAVHLRLIRHVHALVGVGQDKAIHAHHDRQGQFLGDPERLDVQVKRFLVRLGEQLQPAGVAHRHAVGMVVPDVDRGADGTVGHGHHDGQAQPGGVVDRLGHEQQALAGGCRVSPGARRGRTDGHAHGGKFGLDVDELAARERAGFHHFAQPFDDVRLGRDRVGADHLGAAQRDRRSHGMGAFALFKHGGPLPSFPVP
jgi:hypothetical protein